MVQNLPQPKTPQQLCEFIGLGCKRIRTTLYHPISNDHIERFQCQLKSSLKSYPDFTNWMDILPMVLLGIRTTLKDDLRCTIAELVYGITLRLPGEFFDTSCANNAVPDPSCYATKLKTAMQQLKAVPQLRNPKGIRRNSNKPNGVIIAVLWTGS